MGDGIAAALVVIFVWAWESVVAFSLLFLLLALFSSLSCMLGGLLVAGLLAVLVGEGLSPRLALANAAPLCAGCVQLSCLLRGVLRVASYASRQRG